MGDGAGEPRTELQELQFKSNQCTDETLESTRRMLSLCEEVRFFLSRLSSFLFYLVLKIE